MAGMDFARYLPFILMICGMCLLIVGVTQHRTGFTIAGAIIYFILAGISFSVILANKK
jgi:hypothetical protein